jgi:hypothetical protein
LAQPLLLFVYAFDVQHAGIHPLGDAVLALRMCCDSSVARKQAPAG